METLCWMYCGNCNDTLECWSLVKHLIFHYSDKVKWNCSPCNILPAATASTTRKKGRKMVCGAHRSALQVLINPETDILTQCSRQSCHQQRGAATYWCIKEKNKYFETDKHCSRGYYKGGGGGACVPAVRTSNLSCIKLSVPPPFQFLVRRQFEGWKWVVPPFLQCM